MTNTEIYNSALSLLGISANSSDTTDLASRAPYLIASFCCSAKKADEQLRKGQGLPQQSAFNCICLDLYSDFPLCDSLSACASLYLAAMLMIDEDPELSDSLYDKYCSAMAEISSSLFPDSNGEIDDDIYDDDDSYAICESITERYFFD